jgi:hypothetical protein
MALALLLGLGCVFIANAGLGPTSSSSTPRVFILFNGSQAADSTPQASYWIPIRGASEVILKGWSQGATTDTSTCDSITAWTVLVGDSVSFEAVDSLGTIATASNRSGTNPLNGAAYNRFPMVLDSVVVTGDAADTTRGVAQYHPPVLTTQALRWSTTQGWYTWIYPVKPVLGAWAAAVQVPTSNLQSQFIDGYLRVRYTPRTRMTTAGFSSTAGIRTTGLNKFTLLAYVYYPD